MSSYSFSVCISVIRSLRHTVTLTFFHFVTLSLCHTVTPSFRHTVTLSLYFSVILSLFDSVILSLSHPFTLISQSVSQSLAASVSQSSITFVCQPVIPQSAILFNILSVSSPFCKFDCLSVHLPMYLAPLRLRFSFVLMSNQLCLPKCVPTSARPPTI